MTGQRFRPRKGLRVSLLAMRTYSLHPVADRRGAFTIAFTGDVVDRCGSFSVVATQGPGTTIVLRGPKPECPVGPTP